MTTLHEICKNCEEIETNGSLKHTFRKLVNFKVKYKQFIDKRNLQNIDLF